MCTVHMLTLVPFLLQNTGLRISNHHRAGEQEGAEEALQPLPMDSWEIPPDCIIMDTKLGEGQFGEVYKGILMGKDISNPHFKGSEFVAVKILKCESCWYCYCCQCSLSACMCAILHHLPLHCTYVAEANATLKTDFLKEIATMKNIALSNCPHFVNMVGCCTLQEPLSLVLEYIPNGDLRTYLRTIRKLVSKTG